MSEASSDKRAFVGSSCAAGDEAPLLFRSEEKNLPIKERCPTGSSVANGRKRKWSFDPERK